MQNEKINIVLVDDHSLFRTGLAGLLSRRDDFNVVADFGSGEEFLSALDKIEADVVFMDISMPGIDGAETTRRALAHRPTLRIITLSMFGDDHYYTRMVESGASGFLLKDSDINEVYSAVDSVVAGDSYFSTALLGSLTRHMMAPATESESDDDALSNREIEILLEVCRGLSNQEIADKLLSQSAL